MVLLRDIYDMIYEEKVEGYKAFWTEPFVDVDFLPEKPKNTDLDDEFDENVISTIKKIQD